MKNSLPKQTIAEKFGQKPLPPLQREWRDHCHDVWGEKGPKPMQELNALIEEYQNHLDNDITCINNNRASEGKEELTLVQMLSELQAKSDYFDPHHLIANIAQNILFCIQKGHIKGARRIIASVPLSPRAETTLQKVDPERNSLKILKELDYWIEQEFAKNNIPEKFRDAEFNQS